MAPTLQSVDGLRACSNSRTAKILITRVYSPEALLMGALFAHLSYSLTMLYAAFVILAIRDGWRRSVGTARSSGAGCALACGYEGSVADYCNQRSIAGMERKNSRVGLDLVRASACPFHFSFAWNFIVVARNEAHSLARHSVPTYFARTRRAFSSVSLRFRLWLKSALYAAQQVRRCGSSRNGDPPASFQKSLRAKSEKLKQSCPRVLRRIRVASP